MNGRPFQKLSVGRAGSTNIWINPIELLRDIGFPVRRVITAVGLCGAGRRSERGVVNLGRLVSERFWCGLRPF